MPARKHTHKYYYGLVVAGAKVWSCSLPECNHYMPKHMEGRVEGKYTICWKCGETMILDDIEWARSIQKPICYDCRGLGDLVRVNEEPVTIKEMINKEPSITDSNLCKKCKKNKAITNDGYCPSCFLTI